MKRKPVTAAVIGAGHRSLGYAALALSQPEDLRIVAVAEPDEIRRNQAAQMFGLAPEQCFVNAEQLAQAPKLADAAINGTMDRQHVPTSLALLEAGYDILLEKPMAISKKELLLLLSAVRRLGA
jgi:predicted dehydrogenase